MEADDGHGVLPCFSQCQSNPSLTCPIRVTIFLLPLLVNNQTPKSSSIKYCDSAKPDPLMMVLLQRHQRWSAWPAPQTAP